MYAVAVLDESVLQKLPRFHWHVHRFFKKRPFLKGAGVFFEESEETNRYLISLVGARKLGRMLDWVLDEEEFLSPYGIRSVSKYHRDHPYHYGYGRSVAYEPAESEANVKGGNSNWRGPIWFPVNYLIIDALRVYHQYFGKHYLKPCPTRSPCYKDLGGVADDLARRLVSIFLRESGRRPVYGGMTVFQEDPHWKDLILFHEYFHGDNGAGIGASHQTGWTGLAAELIQELWSGPTVGGVVGAQCILPSFVENRGVAASLKDARG